MMLWKFQRARLYSVRWAAIPVAACGAMLAGGSIACDQRNDRLLAPAPVDSVRSPARPASFSVVAGDHQTGFAGVTLEKAFEIEARDQYGVVVKDAAVVWEMEQGSGTFCASLTSDLCVAGRAYSMTESDGHARMWMRPLSPGQLTVRALLVAVDRAPARFTLDSVGVRIRFGPLFDCGFKNDTSYFRDALGAVETRVAVGTRVQFEYITDPFQSCRAQLYSTIAPAEASNFSFDVTSGERVLFVPRRPGIWEFTESQNGGRGRLIVQE